MTPELSIVVLSWNVADLLAACLRSLPGAAGAWWPRTEVLVVDNASTDGTPGMIRRDFPGVRLLALDENRGFAHGNNTGIAASRGKYVMVLNPDTIGHPGSIALLADYLQEEDTVGVVGPRLLNPDGTLQPSRRRFPTLATALIESTPLQRWFANSNLLRRFYMSDAPDAATQEVGWLSGAALMCRREALRQSGLFDPGYFMFSEEVDLCKRISNAGWRIVYLPGARITHFGGQSTGQDLAARHIRFNASKVRYFRVHEGAWAARLVRHYLLAVAGAQLLTEAAKWVLGHKRPLRAERIKLYHNLLRSGLREQRSARAKPDDVLLISGEFPPAHGGVGDYTCRLSLAMNAQQVPTAVLTQYQAGARDELSREPDGQRAAIPCKDRMPFVAKRITLGPVLKSLRGTRASIAHIQYQTGAYQMRPTVNLMPLLLGLAWRGKSVVTFHDLRVPYLFPKAGPVRAWANRLMARSAHAVVATNPEDWQRLRTWGAKNLELIPIGSNIPRDPPPAYDRLLWRKSHGVEPGSILMAYFGFLNSTKGLDDLVRALAILKDSNSASKLQLMMVGGGLGSSDPTNRATAEQLDRLAEGLGVKEDMLWTGYLPRRAVSAALLAADFAVLPFADGASFRRGSLLAVLEHGLPVITTAPRTATGAVPAHWPQLANDVNVLLVPAGNAKELSAAILRLAGDPDLRSRLAAGSTELARYFSWQHIAALHVALYKRPLRRHFSTSSGC